MSSRECYQQVWYCTKFDEIHVIHRWRSDKYLAATEIGCCLIPYTWPRTKICKQYPFIYLGRL